MSVEVKKTNCHFCGYLCAFNAEVEDGRILSVSPDVTRYPYDEKIFNGCRRWKKNLDYLDSDRRVNYPLRRVGERGSGRFERVSWVEALDDIASRLEELRNRYGSGTLASMIGGPHTSFWPLHRFMSNFGSPNNVGIGQICWNPRIWADALTFGWTIEADISDETNTLLIWGTNPAESDNSVFWRHILELSRKPLDERPLIIVVDPRMTKTARIADLHLCPKPGTDATLMLALINVILSDGLEDEEFVQNWCVGVDELKDHVEPYTPEFASEVCGVPADDIRRCARAFANSPSAIVSGRGIDQIGKNVLPTHRARCALLAITGNVDRKGANCLAEPSDFVQELELEQTMQNWETLSKNCINEGITPLQSYSGYQKVEEAMSAHGIKLPARYLTSAHPDLVLKAMETGEPYRISALIVEATNPLLTYADTNRVRDAFSKLDLIVVMDYFMTTTGTMADYILPSAQAMERPTFQAHGGVANFVYGGDAAVEPYYERKVDYDIFRELGLRLGQKGAWPDETFRDACERALAPTGLDWEGYCDMGMYYRAPEFQKHLSIDASGNPKGFATKSGKVEVASELLESMGSTRLPHPDQNRRLCSDDLIAKREAEGFAHIDMITGARKQPYNASMYLDDASFRKSYPSPYVEMSKTTADRLGLVDGDTALLETDQGQARFIVRTDSMRDDLIHVDYGWWHPEWDMSDGRMGGYLTSNVNALTSCSLDQAEPLIGTWSYNAMDCMIKKADQPLEEWSC